MHAPIGTWAINVTLRPNLGSIVPQIRNGRVRPIPTTAEARSPLLPEVPTATEAELREFVVYS
ncbi:hypothetical protein GCM10011504_10890 [Siccirubricoccus deserti]|uniref:tripartite tricarboxylate transporter substrate-binding protein n=1 Tax=Siccirubricoccus deserti TaxID=2013562 RepID=UPI00199229A9|nr:tripartite tricarboxylate transporter substrate-binding protein [Siccirubricoccus deserti]GGC34367.1 hypothetical protein GCM10011504_10890 [Siccirubricoccus deserti]